MINQARLAQGFPAEVNGIQSYQNIEDWWTSLELRYAGWEAKHRNRPEVLAENLCDEPADPVGDPAPSDWRQQAADWQRLK